MDDKFKILLKQLNMPEDEPYYDCKIEKLDITRAEGIYHFYFSMPKLFTPQATLIFYSKLISRFMQIEGVKKVFFTASVRQCSDVCLFDYLETVQELLTIYDPSFKVLSQYKVEEEGGVLYINIKTEVQKEVLEEQFKAKIEKMYASVGIPMHFEIRLSEEGQCTFEELDKRKEEQNLLFQKQLNEQKRPEIEKPDTSHNNSYFYRNRNAVYNEKAVGVPITGPTVPISTIPINPDDLPSRRTDYIIEGTIFECEARLIKDGSTLIDFSMTDYNDSITVKVFVKNEEYLDFYHAIFKVGNYIKLSGSPQADKYSKEVILFCNAAELLSGAGPKKVYEEKGYNGEHRIELHLHTNMSNMDSVVPIEKYVERALAYQHPAIAITDHSGIYALPELYNAVKGKNIKPIYGVEMNLVNDKAKITWNNRHIILRDATYVVLDLETTGFSVNFDAIIEVSAVKLKNGAVIEEFSEFCNPHRSLSPVITELTSITDADLINAREIADVLADFKKFCGDAVLVAQNATFDMSHLYESYEKYGLGNCPNPVIDTLEYARNRFSTQLKRFNLKALVRYFKVELTQHHRAIYDARATAEVFLHLLKDMDSAKVNYLDEINSLGEEGYKYQIPRHITLLAQNETGLKNIFRIISQALTETFSKEARVSRSYLESHREGVLIGSACVEGEIFRTAFEKSYDELLERAKFYDYLEVQPPEVYSHLAYLSGNGETMNYVRETIKTIIRAGYELGIPVVATGDVHHLDREDKLFREIYIDSPQTGGGLHPLSDPLIKEIPSMHFRTTEEMFSDFQFLPEELAKEIIIDNPKKIAERIGEIKPIKDKLFTPTDDFLKDKGIPSIDKKITEQCEERAKSIYGNPLPQIVRDRLDKELNSIIKHGFGVIYYISHMLVKKSLDDDYVVGSRGSVGSSFVATLLDITEVNSLSPHYVCPNCKFSTFKMNEDEKQKYPVRDIEQGLQAILANVDSGFDLPDAVCPVCGSPLKKDGHDIPFETFLGFEGDKVPDIDLNFSGEYQPRAHRYCQEVFGVDNAFRAGTIGTVAEKTAFGFVRAYFEKREIIKREAEIKRIAKNCEGVKRTTGQHPGGIIIVPAYMDIYDITPIQYPADNDDNSFRTTHFDFHSIHDNLLKMDILGHDDPTMLRFLEDLTGIAPKDIPIDDKKVYQLFYSTESLNLNDDIRSVTGSYGIPEFGTNFVRRMLEETHPGTFAELVKISGLSHGTDVWANNAQDLVNNKYPEFGEINFKSLIGCRDDIMVYLMYFGLEPKQAFDIMEFVRKGKPSKEKEKWEKYSVIMRDKHVPEWFIWSCGKIKYMFPKAHATAYVLMAIRIAWFKVNMPIHYYAAYFSKRANTFDVTVLVRGKEVIRQKMDEINIKGATASEKEKDLLTVLELALEMTSRGFYFKQVDLEKSDASNFVITEDGKGLIIPFRAIDGLGTNVALSIVEARREKPFISREDLTRRTSLSKTLIERLGELGCLDHLSESNQLSLFDDALFR